MMYTKDILNYIKETKNINIAIEDIADISTENTKVLKDHGIITLKQLTECPLNEYGKLEGIDHINMINLNEFFEKVFNYVYIVDDNKYYLSGKGEEYLNKIAS